MTTMNPIGVPLDAAVKNPTLVLRHIGPPPGFTGDECGTVEALVGVEDGLPVFVDYWRPNTEQLLDLAAGGYIELRQYAPRMVMHSMTVHTPADAEATE